MINAVADFDLHKVPWLVQLLGLASLAHARCLGLQLRLEFLKPVSAEHLGSIYGFVLLLDAVVHLVHEGGLDDQGLRVDAVGFAAEVDAAEHVWRE